jgi:NAD(P)-dependent dehydrogenase (short-subunit alcohol dehydrogenase family)
MLQNKTILVTGAGGGIGRGIGEACVAKGASVVITDLNEAAAEESAAILRSAYPGCKVVGRRMDVTDAAEVRDVVASAVATFGRLDGLVNNAAVLVDKGLLLDSTPERRAREIAVNVDGLIICSQEFVRRAIQRGGGGAIVNIASAGGRRAHVLMANYSASKAAVMNLTESQSAEWAQYSINVNALCPGGVQTAMLHGAAEAKTMFSRSKKDAQAVRESWIAPQLGRSMKPIEVGYVAAFLLSDEAILIRGQSISVTAGLEHEVLANYLD